MTMWNMGTVVNPINEEKFCSDLAGMSTYELVWNLTALTSAIDSCLRLGNVSYSAYVCIDMANAYLIEIGKRALFEKDLDVLRYAIYDMPKYMKDDECDV